MKNQVKLIFLFILILSAPAFAKEERTFILTKGGSGIEQSTVSEALQPIDMANIASGLPSSGEIAEYWSDSIKPNPQQVRPPLRSEKLFTELLVGSLSGVLLAGVVGAAILSTDETSNNGYGTAIAAILICSLCYISGSSIGVYFIGDSGNETGSYLATLGGSCAGGLIGMSATKIEQELFI